MDGRDVFDAGHRYPVTDPGGSRQARHGPQRRIRQRRRDGDPCGGADRGAETGPALPTAPQPTVPELPRAGSAGSARPSVGWKRVHRLERRIHPHQQPRRCRRQHPDRVPPGQTVLPRHAGGAGSVYGRGGHQDRRGRPHQAESRKLRRAPCGRVDRGHRQSGIRWHDPPPGLHGNGRHRQRSRPASAAASARAGTG